VLRSFGEKKHLVFKIMSRTITHSRSDFISTIRLNRPEKLNSLSSEMMQDLRQQLTELETDQALRVVILLGEGEQAFCAGTDVAEVAGKTEAEAIEVSARGQKLCEQIENFPVPVIAAIDGIAAGGGFELALACHLRVASAAAAFSLPETKLGLIPAYGGTQRLAREVGQARALEMMLTARTMSADEAFDLGLVNRLATSSSALAEATSLAAEIAHLSPLSIRACLKAVTMGIQLPLDEGLALETELFASLFATEDVREGTSAFLEKRPPVFSGK
jgi:enoyl-CoA hydratase